MQQPTLTELAKMIDHLLMHPTIVKGSDGKYSYQGVTLAHRNDAIARGFEFL